MTCQNSFEITSRALWDRIPKEQHDRVFSDGMASCQIDPDFMGFVDIYESLSRIIPKHFIIVDLGCAFAPQSFYFEDHKEYIGVDVGDTSERYVASNTKHFHGTIQAYIERLKEAPLDGPAFAICSYVPQWHGFTRSMVGAAFDDCFVFYPKESPSVRFGSVS